MTARKNVPVDAPENGVTVRAVVGMFLHTLKDGKIEWQGEIIGIDGDMMLVQLFSWLDGSPTEVVGIPRSTVYSDKCILYSSAHDMNWSYEKSRHYKD